MPIFPREVLPSPSFAESLLHEIASTSHLNIYIERRVGLGDVLLAALATNGLKRKLPSSFKVHFITHPQFQGLVQKLGLVDSVRSSVPPGSLSIDLQGQVDFLPVCKRGHRLDLMATLIGLKPEEVNTSYKIVLDKTWRNWGIKQLRKLKRRPRICLAVWAISTVRSWPNWFEFISLATSRRWSVVLLHNNRLEYLNTANVLNLTGKTDAVQLVSVIDACDLLVASDSGPLHIAGFLGIPFVGLFGSIKPEFRTKYYSNKEIIFLNGSCKHIPCFDWQLGACENQPFYMKCMKDISPEMVMKKIDLLMKREKG